MHGSQLASSRHRRKNHILVHSQQKQQQQPKQQQHLTSEQLPRIKKIMTNKASYLIVATLLLVTASVRGDNKYLRNQQQRLVEHVEVNVGQPHQQQQQPQPQQNIPVPPPSISKFNWFIQDPNSQANGTSDWILNSSGSRKDQQGNTIISGTYSLAPTKQYQVSLYDSECRNLLGIVNQSSDTTEQQQQRNQKKVADIPVTLSTSSSSIIDAPANEPPSSSSTNVQQPQQHHQPLTVDIEIDPTKLSSPPKPSLLEDTASTSQNLDFCVRLDLLSSDGESVNFHESHFSLSPEKLIPTNRGISSFIWKALNF